MTLREDQAQTAALAINQLEKGGGFLNASGTGAGKTATAAAVARYFNDQGKKVLIVAPKNVWSFDKDEVPGGSYGTWFEQYGIKPVSYRSGVPVEDGKTYVSTYERFTDFPTDKNTIVVYDEAHNLKNPESAKAGTGIEQLKNVGGTYYMTATPADKPYHIHYLENMGILQGRSKKEAVADLGMELVGRQRKDGTIAQQWQIRRGFTPQMIRRRFANLFDQMIREGKMRKDEISLENMDLGVHMIELPQEAHDVATKIENELGMKSAGGLKRASILGHIRRQQEPFKIDATVDLVNKDIAAGRKAVVFLSRVNRSDVKKREKIRLPGGETQWIEKVIHSSEGTAKTLKERLIAEGHEVAEIHGGSETGNTEAMRRFQSGEADVVIATAPSGGVGINLDDAVGTAPRTIYVMTPEFDAMNNVQLIGRGYRASTKSRPRVKYLFANSPIDQWNMGILSNKIKTLQSVVKGESGKLNMMDYIPDDDAQGMPDAPEPEEAAPTPGGTPRPRGRKKPYMPQVGERITFISPIDGARRLGEVTRMKDGRILVKPFHNSLKGLGEIDVTDQDYKKGPAQSGAGRSFGIAGAAIGLGAASQQGDKDKDRGVQPRTALPEQLPSGALPVGIPRPSARPQGQPPKLEGLEGRYSPLGYPEYIVPERSSRDYMQYRQTAAETHSHPDEVFYRKEWANDPGTQAHERIHLAQNQLPVQPSVDQLATALRPMGVTKQDILAHVTKGEDPNAAALEMPAYLFGNEPQWDKPRDKANRGKIREAYRNYINLLRQLNPGLSHHIEAAMPSEYELNYLRTEAPPLPRPGGSMRQVSLLTGQATARGFQ